MAWTITNCEIQNSGKILTSKKAFPDDGFYTFEGKRYCLHDFQLLYAPICKRCQCFVEGEVVKVSSKPFPATFGPLLARNRTRTGTFGNFGVLWMPVPTYFWNIIESKFQNFQWFERLAILGFESICRFRIFNFRFNYTQTSISLRKSGLAHFHIFSKTINFHDSHQKDFTQPD